MTTTTWVIAKSKPGPSPSRKPYTSYWTDTTEVIGGFAVISPWTPSLGPPSRLTGAIRTFPSKQEAVAAFRKDYGRLPRDHRAVQLTPKQTALVREASQQSQPARPAQEPPQKRPERPAEPSTPTIVGVDMERVAPVVPGTYTDPDSCVFGAHKHLDNAIRDHARKIAYHLPEFRRLIIQAKADGLHTMLGFKSWTAYVADVIGTEMTALPVEDRRQIVELLSGEGMSNRAIAEAVGVSHPTVIRDKAAIEAEVVHDVPPERGGDEVVRDVPPESVTVVGRDNKTYPAKRRTLDEINAERAARGQPPVQKARKFTPREKVEREAKAIAADIRSIVTRLRELKAADRALNEGYRWSEQEDAYDDIEDALEALRNWYNS